MTMVTFRKKLELETRLSYTGIPAGSDEAKEAIRRVQIRRGLEPDQHEATDNAYRNAQPTPAPKKKKAELKSRVCIECGDPFTTTSWNRKTCSPKCQSRMRRRHGMTPEEYAESMKPRSAICKRCGITFETKYVLKEYCSHECLRRAINARNRQKKGKANAA